MMWSSLVPFSSISSSSSSSSSWLSSTRLPLLITALVSVSAATGSLLTLAVQRYQRARHAQTATTTTTKPTSTSTTSTSGAALASTSATGSSASNPALVQIHDNTFLSILASSTSTSTPTTPSSSTTTPYALVILNTASDDLLLPLCRHASVILCADGGANRLYDACQDDTQRAKFLPHVIIGDLDSIESHVRQYYQEQGIPIIDQSYDQDTTDLQKCLFHIIQHQHSNNTWSKIQIVLVYGAFGGRWDQEMATIAALYQHSSLFSRLLLLNNGNLAELMTPGIHRIVCNPLFEDVGSHCGVIPIGEACESITTQGLEWDMTSAQSQFGGLVSTCNKIKTGVICLSCTSPLIWTSEFRLPSSHS